MRQPGIPIVIGNFPADSAALAGHNSRRNPGLVRRQNSVDALDNPPSQIFNAALDSGTPGASVFTFNPTCTSHGIACSAQTFQKKLAVKLIAADHGRRRKRHQLRHQLRTVSAFKPGFFGPKRNPVIPVIFFAVKIPRILQGQTFHAAIIMININNFPVQIINRRLMQYPLLLLINSFQLNIHKSRSHNCNGGQKHQPEIIETP